MKKIFVINGAPKFAHSGGEFNKTLSDWTVDYFKDKDYDVKYTDINDEYNLSDEVGGFRFRMILNDTLTRSLPKVIKKGFILAMVGARLIPPAIMVREVHCKGVSICLLRHGMLL